MLEQALLVTGALIFGVLGSIHLVYTFAGNRFDPRDAATRAAMQATSPVISRRLTMWQAWIGFNGSHSLGAMVFAAFVLLLALGHMDFLRGNPEFAWLAFVNAAAWFAVGCRYWFRTPLTGIGLAGLCFLIAALRLSFA
jgi:hypothetical protein